MLNQENRSLKLQCNNLSTNALLPIKVILEEAISQPYCAKIHCISQQRLTGKSLIGQAATLTLTNNSANPHYVNGIINAVQCDIKQYPTGLYRYFLTLVPVFVILKKIQDCQFFTAMSVPEIFKSYSSQLGFLNYDLTKLQKTYPQLTYKTQFNETAFDFLSRLLQEANIYYYFQQSETQHIMRLHDAEQQFPYLETTADFTNTKNQLFSWHNNQSLLMTQQSNFINASGNYANFSAGYIFKLAEELDDNGAYLITSITHLAEDYTYVPQSMSQAIDSDVNLSSESQTYQNQFECIDITKYCYRQSKAYLKPRMPNLQIAKVAARKDCTEDANPDAIGRVQLQFPWDRQQKLSCWVDVCQSMSGSAFAAQFIPRIGQEVLVSYINGDCDQPVIINAVANANNKPAYDLTKKPNLSWIKSNTLNSKDSNKANQIIFDNTEQQEQLGVIAEKNYIEQVENDSLYSIKNDDTLHVEGDELLQVLQGKITVQGQTIRLFGGGSQILIDGNRVTVQGSEGSNSRVNLFSRNAGAIQPIARVGDPHQCPKQTGNVAHHGGPILKGASSVTANNQMIAREGDTAVCRVGNDTINQGVSSVLVNGKPVARLNASLAHGGVITGGSPNVYVGEKPHVQDIYQLLHIKPKYILVIQVCDFYNVAEPNDKQACMNKAIQAMSARALALLNDGTQRPWPISSVINGKIYLPGQQPTDINFIDLYFEPSAVYPTQQVNIIAVNNQPIPPSDCIRLKGNDFSKMPNYKDKGNNICYPMTITVLQPAMLFNFRQDNWLHDLTAEETQAYDAVKSYYPNPQPWNTQIDSLSEDEVNYFKNNGNNATFYIHGFNVPIGNFAKGFTWEEKFAAFSNQPILIQSMYDSTLYRDATTVPTNLREAFLNFSPTSAADNPCLVGTDAHRWLVCMEHNLNQAAGMPTNDYRKFTRLIFINWQGDPVHAYDYMAANCLTQFAARKTFALIQQLNRAGIKITIMAHSLGSAVLMQILNLCSVANLSIDHAFLWQAAIPNTAFKPNPRWYFPMLNRQQPEVVNPLLPYSYNFTQAVQGTKGVTILYSHFDNILGPMPDDIHSAILEGKTACQLGKAMLEKVVIDAMVMLGVDKNSTNSSTTTADWVSLAAPYPGSVAAAEKFTLRNHAHLAELAAKIYDPATGMQYAVIADLIDILDKYFVPIVQIHKKLLSIYHLANMFVMPFSYLLISTSHYEDYFQLWRKSYSHFQLTQDGITQNQSFANNFAAQIQLLKNAYPKTYQFIHACVNDINQLKAGKVPSWLSEEEQTANKKMKDLTNDLDESVISSLIAFLLGKAEQHENTALSETVEKYTNNPLISFLTGYPDYLTTLMLMVLLTPDAVPAQAMGWKGIEKQHEYFHGECCKTVDQKNLLPDHSGMLFPNSELYKKIYVQHLLGGKQGEQFNFFGLYKPA